MRILLTLFSLSFFITVAKGETLHLSYHCFNDIIKCEAIFKDEVKLNLLRMDSILNPSIVAYGIVQGKYHKEQNKFEQNINKLSKELLTPISEMIGNCTLIKITLDTALLKIPFEYLHVNNIELSILKPMLFKLEGAKEEQLDSESFFELKSGTIIRDKSCDPQNACRKVKKNHPKMSLFSTKEKLPNDIETTREDVLLISAHGYAYEKNRGILGWNKIHLKQETLKKLNPKITYFDSCQQGINLNYLEALQQTEDLNYYIAPIISNDSGDSSTKTIKWFFDFLSKSTSPAVALNLTKKKLNAHYKNKKKLTRYNKAFSFRIYMV